MSRSGSNRILGVLAVCALVLGVRGAAWAQDADETDEDARSARSAARGETPGGALGQTIARLIRATRSLGDWETQSEYLVIATERSFERAGWDSEEDLFALELMQEINRIPPWNLQERLDTLNEMIGDRYDLDDEQRQRATDLMLEMGAEVLGKHSEQILTYATEIIATRAEGEPFTPEQVARWAGLAKPVMEDATRVFQSRVGDFTARLRPEQREIFERDMKADGRRLSDISAMMEKWKRGEWSAEDWGLDDDPIQNRTSASAAARDANPSGEASASEAARGARPLGERVEPAPHAESQADAGAGRARRPAEPDDAWARFVRRFVQRYALDDEQQQRAWQFYREAKQREASVLERVRQPAPASRDARTVRQIERVFEQLRQRLERLPTRAQRRAGDAGKP